MREINLANGGTALIDDSDYERVAALRWVAFGVRHGKTKYAFHRSWVRGQNCWNGFSMHRFIMQVEKGKEVDHINHDGLDNRRENLRIAERWQNACGSTRKDNKHGFRGVRFGNSGYVARVQMRGKEYYVGTFSDLVEAARARDRMAIKLHGEFAYTNFPRGDYADTGLGLH